MKDYPDSLHTWQNPGVTNTCVTAQQARYVAEPTMQMYLQHLCEKQKANLLSRAHPQRDVLGHLEGVHDSSVAVLRPSDASPEPRRPSQQLFPLPVLITAGIAHDHLRFSVAPVCTTQYVTNLSRLDTVSNSPQIVAYAALSLHAFA